MIGKIGRGRGFRGLLDYIFGPQKIAELLGGNMLGRSARELAQEFGVLRATNSRVRTPVIHITLSLPRGETADGRLWSLIAAALLEELGLGAGRPWVFVRHRNREHDHVHIVTSRVAHDGTVWLGHWQVRQLLAAKAKVEKAFGLTVTPLPAPNAVSWAPTNGKMREMSRLLGAGQDVPLIDRAALAATIDTAVAESGGNLQNLQRILREAGVTLRLNKSRTTDRICGVSFCGPEGAWLKGSQLGSAYAWRRLSARLAALSEPHDNDRTTLPPQPAGRAAPDDALRDRAAADIDGDSRHAPHAKRNADGPADTLPDGPAGDTRAECPIGGDPAPRNPAPDPGAQLPQPTARVELLASVRELATAAVVAAARRNRRQYLRTIQAPKTSAERVEASEPPFRPELSLPPPPLPPL